MDDFKNKTTNEILSEISEMQQEHEALKHKILSDFDKLETIEKKFKLANDELIKRLNGEV